MRLLSKVKTKISYEIKVKFGQCYVPISLKALRDKNLIIFVLEENIRDIYVKT